jgi:putative Mg2+ transporter-C (MgtC) family protein
MSCVVIYIIVSILSRFDTRIQDHTTVIPLYLEFNKKHPFSDFLQYARENKISVTDIQLSKNKFLKKMAFGVTVVVKSEVPRLRSEVIKLIQSAEGVQFLEEL